jgi:hypothetical protein
MAPSEGASCGHYDGVKNTSISLLVRRKTVLKPLPEAIPQDMGKPKVEVFAAEIAPAIERCLISAGECAKPKIVDVPDWQKHGCPPCVQRTEGRGADHFVNGFSLPSELCSWADLGLGIIP